MRVAQPKPNEPIRLRWTKLDADGKPTKDSQPRYRVRLDVGRHPRTGRRKQEWTTHDSLTKAREYVAEHKTDRRRGQLVTLDRTNRQTFSEFADAWVTGRENGTIVMRRGKKSGGLRPNTAASYRYVLRRADEVFGGKHVSDVTEDDIARMLARIADDGNTARTASFTLFVVRAVLNHAVARRIVPRNVADTEGIGAAGAASKQREAFTADELAKLRAYLARDRDRRLAEARLSVVGEIREDADKRRRDRFPADGLYACWLLTLYGLRRSEVLGLRWSDVDLKAKTLTVSRGRVDVGGREVIDVEPKTKRGRRTLPLSDTPDLLTALRAMREFQLAEFGAEQVRDGYLAVDKIGQPLRPEVWTDQWKRHCEAAGVRALTLHCARHSSVTLMRDRGVPDHLVAAWHGHDEQVMRTSYSHAHVKQLAGAGGALSTIFGAVV